MPRFLAFDGEGTNQSNGEQYYTLLCSAGNRTRNHIEDYEHGLSTEQCLQFFLDHAFMDAVKVGFFFTYDVTKILRDLSEMEKKALWDAGWIFWAGKSSVRYFIKFIPGKILTVGTVAGDAPLDPEQFDHHKHLTTSFTLFDVSGFFQCAFVKALAQWKVGEEYLAFIAEMKAKRNDFVVEDKDTIRTYCFRECHYLVQLMDKLAAALWDAELYVSSWHGAGAIADAMFRRHKVVDHMEELPPDVLDAALGAYFGGRAEIFRQGIIPEGIHDYDLNSAYPSAAIQLPSLKEATWQHVTEYDPHAEWSLWRVSWNICDTIGGMACPRALLGPLPFRYKGRVCFPFMAGPTWCHGLELRAAMEVFGVAAFHVHEGFVLVPGCNDKPFGFLEEVARARIAAKKAGDWKHIPMKLGMNSVYGKLAQGQVDPKRPPKYLNYFWAGAITAHCRAKLLKAAASVGDRLVAIATDGLFVTCEVPDLDLGNTPGTWEWATEDGPIQAPIVIQAGVMYSQDGSIAKSRGFGKETLNYNRAVDIWHKDGPYGVIHYTERRFIGLGTCAGRGKAGDFRLYGRWVEVPREVNFHQAGPKFCWPSLELGDMGLSLPAPDYTEESYWLVPWDMTREHSQPFKPKPLLSDEDAWAALDIALRQELEDLRDYRLDHLDQPDWDDDSPEDVV